MANIVADSVPEDNVQLDGKVARKATGEIGWSDMERIVVVAAEEAFLHVRKNLRLSKDQRAQKNPFGSICHPFPVQDRKVGRQWAQLYFASWAASPGLDLLRVACLAGHMVVMVVALFSVKMLTRVGAGRTSIHILVVRERLERATTAALLPFLDGTVAVQ